MVLADRRVWKEAQRNRAEPCNLHGKEEEIDAACLRLCSYIIAHIGTLLNFERDVTDFSSHIFSYIRRWSIDRSCNRFLNGIGDVITCIDLH
jgi:hypothetical protein